jgi:hypothetical protein
MNSFSIALFLAGAAFYQFADIKDLRSRDKNISTPRQNRLVSTLFSSEYKRLVTHMNLVAV